MTATVEKCDCDAPVKGSIDPDGSWLECRECGRRWPWLTTCDQCGKGFMHASKNYPASAFATTCADCEAERRARLRASAPPPPTRKEAAKNLTAGVLRFMFRAVVAIAVFAVLALLADKTGTQSSCTDPYLCDQNPWWGR